MEPNGGAGYVLARKAERRMEEGEASSSDEEGEESSAVVYERLVNPRLVGITLIPLPWEGSAGSGRYVNSSAVSKVDICIAELDRFTEIVNSSYSLELCAKLGGKGPENSLEERSRCSSFSNLVIKDSRGDPLKWFWDKSRKVRFRQLSMKLGNPDLNPFECKLRCLSTGKVLNLDQSGTSKSLSPRVPLRSELGRLISETLPPSLQTNPIRLPQFVRLDCEPDEESAVDKLRKASACLIDGGFISHARKQGSTATTKMSADA
nr:Alpha-2-macroglobulin [Ipomoea batatas]